jgi:hypothetical protein
MADFEGQGAYLGLGRELAPGVPGSISTWLPFDSEEMAPEVTREANNNVRPRVGPGRGRVLSMAMGGNTTLKADPESAAIAAAHQLGKVDTTNPGDGDVYLHVMEFLQPGDDEEAVYRKTLFSESYRDDGRPFMVPYVKVSERVITMTEGAFVEEQITLMGGVMTTLDDPVADLDGASTFSGTAHVYGIPRAGLAGDIIVEITTGGALDGTAKAKVKVTEGASHSSEEYAVVSGKKFRIKDHEGAHIGVSPDKPVQFMLRGTGNLAAGDTFTISYPRAVASPSFSTRNVYIGGQVVVTVNATEAEYIVNSAVVTVSTPQEHRQGLGSTWNQKVRKAPDNVSVTVSLEREYVDTDLWDALLANQSVSVKFEMEGDAIEGVVLDKRMIEVFAMDVESAGPGGTDNVGAYDESVTLGAYDNGTDPLYRETWRNTIAVL